MDLPLDSANRAFRAWGCDAVRSRQHEGPGESRLIENLQELGYGDGEYWYLVCISGRVGVVLLAMRIFTGTSLYRVSGGRTVAASSEGKSDTLVSFSHGLAFVLGFSTVFITLGVATSAVGGLLYDARGWLAKIGGVVIIIFGLHMTGLLRIPLLEYDLRPQSAPQRKRGYLASFLMGVFFSAGWSPCVGPILGAILTIALNGGSISQGVILLTAYSAGLAIPFLVASVEIGLVTSVIRRYRKLTHYVEIAMGVLLIIVGVLLLSGQFQKLAQLSSFFDYYNELALGRLLLFLFFALVVLGIVPGIIASRKRA